MKHLWWESTIHLVRNDHQIHSRKGQPGEKRGKFVGSMAASINGRWLLQHCQIETIETSSSDGRTELRLASVLAHTDTHKKEDAVHYLLMRMSFHFTDKRGLLTHQSQWSHWLKTQMIGSVEEHCDFTILSYQFHCNRFIGQVLICQKSFDCDAAKRLVPEFVEHVRVVSANRQLTTWSDDLPTEKSSAQFLEDRRLV